MMQRSIFAILMPFSHRRNNAPIRIEAMRIPTLYGAKSECCGCAACKAICPIGAISFFCDERGFSYPTIDEQKCIGCFACEKVCAFKHDLRNLGVTSESVEACALTIKDEATLEASSSGGAFTCLSDLMYQDGGVVACCVYDYDSHQLVFKLTGNVAERDLARGSKYFQANSEDIYNQLYDWLQKNPKGKAMFVGTGCQVAGLDGYAKTKGIRDRLILVDLICNGVPSPGLWREYARFIERKAGGPISRITFKDKTKGWEDPSQFAVVNGKRIEIGAFSDWFYDGLTQRDSCYVCPYTRLTRVSDLTIGDFWGVSNAYPEAYDSRGVSLVLAHTQVGRELIHDFCSRAKVHAVSAQDCLQPRLEYPLPAPKERTLFWNNVGSKGLSYCIRRHKLAVAVKRFKRKARGLARKILRPLHA